MINYLLNLVNLLQFVIFTASLRVGRLLRHIQALRVIPLVCLLAWRFFIVVAVVVFRRPGVRLINFIS